MSYQSITLRLTGTCPLMISNVQQANPLNPLTQRIAEITGKRKKTMEDQEFIARLKFEASLYIDSKGRYIIPCGAIQKSIAEGAKEFKKMKLFDEQGGISIIEDPIIEFPDKDKTVDELYKLGTYVDSRVAFLSNRGSKTAIIATRAIFPEWSLLVKIFFDDELVDKKEVLRAATTAGQRFGIGTFRKRFGRFTIEEI